MPEQNNILKDGLGIEQVYKGIVDNIEYHGKQLDKNINLGGDFFIYVENQLENYNRELNILLKKGEQAL